MTDNLAEMIQDENIEVQTFNEADLNISDEVIESAEENVEETPEIEDPNAVKSAMLCDWFEENHNRFPNVGPVKAAIQRVDPRKTLIIAADIKDSFLEDGSPERTLFVFNNADTYPVINLPGSEMEIFNNGIKINYDYDVEENIYLKTYGIKSGIFVVFCNKVDDILIPYNVTKFKKKDEILDIIVNENIDNISTRMEEDVDKEALQVMYKPASKSIDDITTIKSAIVWLLDKQKDVMDVNHLLKIDECIIKQFS